MRAPGGGSAASSVVCGDSPRSLCPVLLPTITLAQHDKSIYSLHQQTLQSQQRPHLLSMANPLTAYTTRSATTTLAQHDKSTYPLHQQTPQGQLLGSHWLGTLMLEHKGEVVHAAECIGMLLARHLLPQFERLPMHLFYLFILLLAAEHRCEVVHAAESISAGQDSLRCVLPLDPPPLRPGPTQPYRPSGRCLPTGPSTVGRKPSAATAALVATKLSTARQAASRRRRRQWSEELSCPPCC